MKQNNSNINDQINADISEPMSNKEYKKMIANAKSKYMQDYKDTTNKKSKFMEEKYFNNLLSTYYDDYIKLKNKFNLKDKDDTEKNNLNVDEKDFEIKKENINQIFSGDLLEIQDFNFDFCDNLISEIPKENNYTLLKSTQNKKDYELRLQGFNNKKINKNTILNEEQNEDEEDKVNLKGKNSTEKINNNNNINNNDNNDNKVNNSENNIERKDNEEKESFEYLENNEQFKENNDNYLILNQQNIDEDLPLFSDIISSKYNKNYRIPFYEHDEDEPIKEEKNIIIKKVDDDENKLILVNENKKYMKFEDIIKNDFNEDYKIPEYKIPNDIKKEIEEEQKNKQEQKITYEENKNNNVINNEVNNVIKIKESGAFIGENDTKVEEKKENENIKEENDNNKIKKEEENNNDNYEDEKFEKIDVDKLNEIDDDSGNNNIGNNNDQNNQNNYNDKENRKYDDFEG